MHSLKVSRSGTRVVSSGREYQVEIANYFPSLPPPKKKKLLTQVKATYLPFSLGILYTDFPNLYLQCCSKFLKKQRHLSLLRNDYWLF